MNERDEKGRFGKGNKASPGRPRKVTENEYVSATVNRVPLTKWSKVIDKALEDALTGDRYARHFLAEYLLGKPPTIIDLRADEAAMLGELLKRFEANGLSSSDVFRAMLEQTSEAENEAG